MKKFFERFPWAQQAGCGVLICALLLSICLPLMDMPSAAPDNPIKSERETESDGNTHADCMMYDMATSSAVNRRGRRKNEQTERTNAAVTARWPPLTAMRCTIPDLWNASSTCAAYVESMSVPSPSAGT